MNRLQKPKFSSRRCVACWECVNACPRHAIGKVQILWHRHAVLRYASCIGCHKCVSVCPHGCFTLPE